MLQRARSRFGHAAYRQSSLASSSVEFMAEEVDVSIGPSVHAQTRFFLRRPATGVSGHESESDSDDESRFAPAVRGSLARREMRGRPRCCCGGKFWCCASSDEDVADDVERLSDGVSECSEDECAGEDGASSDVGTACIDIVDASDPESWNELPLDSLLSLLLAESESEVLFLGKSKSKGSISECAMV